MITTRKLLSKLFHRARVVRKLSWMMPLHLFKSIANGIFFSILSYGIQLYGSVSDIDEYLEASGWQCQETLVICFRSSWTLFWELSQSLTGRPQWKFFWREVDQMCAFYTICLVKQILTAKEPKFLFEKNHLSLQSRSQRSRHYAHTGCLNKNISISRESFLDHGPVFCSKLPETLTSIEIMAAFKKSVKQWVKENNSIYMWHNISQSVS